MDRMMHIVWTALSERREVYSIVVRFFLDISMQWHSISTLLQMLVPFLLLTVASLHPGA